MTLIVTHCLFATRFCLLTTLLTLSMHQPLILTCSWGHATAGSWLTVMLLFCIANVANKLYLWLHFR